MSYSKEIRSQPTEIQRDLLHYIPEIETITTPQFTIATDHFARPITNAQLLKRMQEAGTSETELTQAQQIIENTGFSKRFTSLFLEQTQSFKNVTNRSAMIGAILLNRALKARDWNGVDVVINTSSYLPTIVGSKMLERVGISPTSVEQKSYRYACAGFAGALIDALHAYQGKNVRIAIVGLEPLSYLLDKRLYTPQHIASPAIFGDNYGVFLFNPRDFRLEHAKIIVKDDGGVIRLKTGYRFNTKIHHADTVPPYYEVDRHNRNIFRYSENGAFLNIRQPESDLRTEMDGLGTGLFFGNETSQLIGQLLQESGHPQFLFTDEVNVVTHQPSEPVQNNIGKKLRRAGFAPTNDALPFRMQEFGEPNSSSMTTMSVLYHMLKGHEFDPRHPTLLVAPGIGAVIAGAIVKFSA